MVHITSPWNLALLHTVIHTPPCSLFTVMPHFSNEINKACVTLENGDPEAYIDENEFIDASRLVYDGVREVRRAVLTNRVSKLRATLTYFNLSFDLLLNYYLTI